MTMQTGSGPVDMSGDPMAPNITPGTPNWWLNRLSAKLVGRNEEMGRYARYYAGVHELSSTGFQVSAVLGSWFKHARVNYCSIVVDKLVERLEVIGFRNGPDAKADEALWGIWQDNSLDQEFGKGLREGAIKGEFSVSVWPDKKGKPQIRIQDPMNMVVATDPEDRRVRRAALKRWFDVDMGMWYATLYLPDTIRKFQAKTAPGNPYMLDQWEHPQWERQAPWMTWVPREMADGTEPTFKNPLGVVPVIPFPNKPDTQGVGVSELRDIVPIQDVINEMNFDLIRASGFAAFPQKWAVNVDLEVNVDTGEPKMPWKLAVDRILIAPPPDSPSDQPVQFGQFEAAELSNWVETLESKLREIAVISRMPPHYLLGGSGIFPSGESLRAAETGLVYKVRDRQRDDGEPLEEVMRLAATIAREDIADAQNLETLWRDPETRTESEHLTALQMMAGLGVPMHGLWARIPATPTEIAQWDQMLKDGDVAPVPFKGQEIEQLQPPGTEPATPPPPPGPLTLVRDGQGKVTQIKREAS